MAASPAVDSSANPFRPGAGHMPPYLAGRQHEFDEFKKLLRQDVVLHNLVLTGLRGVGKTVLLDTLKPSALEAGWFWAGADLSEAMTLTEERVAVRLITDLAAITSSLTIARVPGFGFKHVDEKLDFETMLGFFNKANGLIADKLKALLEFVWLCLQKHRVRGVIFAYDEAQNMADHARKEEYPLSLLLEVFQSIQKKNVPFMLALVGLPTLYPKLVETRTFAERMFRVLFLDRLGAKDSTDAVLRPIQRAKPPVRFSKETVSAIVEASAGYPYFLQFFGREVCDAYLQQIHRGRRPQVRLAEIARKLDSDFYAGRWSKATDRQRELLTVIARLKNADREFTVQEIVAASKRGPKRPFSPSHVNQMLLALAEAGLVYKNRHGRYSFAVPLFGQFILRQVGGP